MKTAITTAILTTTLTCSALAQTTSDRLLWSFQTEARSTRQFIALANDGTIYTNNNASTYALSPDGALEWSTSIASGDGYGGRPISVANDGTLYTGDGTAIVALHPDGSLRWRFETPATPFLAAGPSVGPDGNIYAFQESPARGGLGAFALDPGGNLLWDNPGEPAIQTTDLLSNSEIVFTPGRLHAGIVGLRSGGNPIVHTFSLEGGQIWTTSDLDVHTTSFPVVDPSDRIILTWGQTGIRALSQDGVEEWVTRHPDGPSYMLRPTVGASGTIYAADSFGIDLWAINPDGSTKWVTPSVSSTIQGLSVSPDERVIVAYGGGGFGEGGWIRGYSADGGALLWQVDLTPEQGLLQYASTYRPVFTPDSSTVYLTTQFVGDGVGYGYVLAIDLTDGACRADLDGDGELTLFDFLSFQNLFDAGAPTADFDGDGDLTIFDFLAFQNEFDAGCA